jgi:hypothetical protein
VIVLALIHRAQRSPAAAPLPGSASAPGSALTNGGCAAVPHACGFPDATNTGVPPGVILRSVPRQVSSGPGWSFDPAAAIVRVTGNGADLTDLYIPHPLDILASNVTVQDVRVVTGGDLGVSLLHTRGVTIENCTISGRDRVSGRVGAAIKDVYGDSTRMVIRGDNISDFKTGVQISTGLVTGNYIHDPGYIAGDHTNGILDAGTGQPLTINDNTILNNLGQTDAISIDASGTGRIVANKLIEHNLLAGGGYTIYAGSSLRNSTSNIIIKGNRFSQLYYPRAGTYGPAAYFNPRGTGNRWSGNVWSGPVRPGSVRDKTGQDNTILPPG